MSTDTDTNASSDAAPQRALNRVDEAIYAVDDEWRFSYLNERAAAVLDRDPDALLGKRLWEAIPEARESEAYDRFHEAMERQEPTRFDMHYEPLDAWFTVRAYPDSDGLTVCFYDVTEERGQQLELQRKQRLFEAVFQDTEDALVVADTDRCITEFNPAAERLFGYEAREVEGQPASLLYANEKDYQRTGEERFNEQAPERYDSYVVEYERADGTTFQGETVGTPLLGPDEETLAFLGAVRNVTDRLEYEREIKVRNEALRAFHEATTDERLSFETQLQAVLELGVDHLDLETGILAAIDGDDYTVEHVVSPDDSPVAGDEFDLSETFCERVLDRNESVGFVSAPTGHPAHRTHGVESYLGAPVTVDGDVYGTINFTSTGTRERDFSDGEETFVRLLAQWVGKELSRRRNRRRAKANSDRLRQIIDMLPQLVFAKDETGEFLVVNEAVAEAYGTTVDELEGSTDADFADSEAEAEQFREDDRAVIESGEAKHIPEETLTTADGEQRLFETRKIPYEPVDSEMDAVLGVANDITDRKEQEAELQVRSAAIEASMDGIAILDTDGVYVYMNQAHADVFDYEPSDLVGQTWRDVYGNDEIERLEAEVFPTLDAVGEWRGETVGRKRDGSPVAQEITLSRLDDGKLVCINRDITERKERERELETKTTQLDAILDHTTAPMFMKDASGEYVLANRRYREVFGFDAGEVVGKTDHDIHPEPMADEVRANDRTVIEDGESLEAEERIQVDDEERIYITSKSPIYGLRDDSDDETPDAVFGVANDITERKRREAELRDLKERLNLAVDGADLGVWDWNMVTDEVTFNDRWATMLDLSPVEIEPTLATWEERVHPDDVARVEAQLQAHVDGETDRYDCEHRMRTASGDWLWVRDVGKVVARDEQGDPTRAVGIHLDVTERKESQKFLEEERDMFAQGPAVVFKWQRDEGWPVEYVSDNVTDTFGYTPSELQSGAVPYADLVHDDDLERVIQEVDENSDETTERFSHDPYRMVTRDGDVKWVKDNTKIIRNDGEITHYLGYLVDITERKRREQELQRIRQRFERFAETVPNGFFLVDPDYTETLYANSATKHLYGVSASEAVDDPREWTKHVHPDDRDRVRKTMRKQDERSTDWPVKLEFRIEHPDRGLRWLQTEIHPVRNDSGELIELAGVATDVTQRKELEASLRESEHSLRKLTEIAADTERDFEAKLDAILELGRERLGLPYAFLNRIDTDTQHVVDAKGTHPLLQPGESASLSQSYCRKTIESGGLLGVDDAPAEGWSDDPAYETFELGCYLGGKVMVNDDLYGTLCFAGDERRDTEFDESERAFVELLVQWVSYELAGNAVETKLRGLNETAQQFISAESPADIAEFAVESANTVLDMPITGVWWYDDTSETLVPETTTDLADAVIGDPPTFERGDALAWDAFETGEVRVYGDLTDRNDVYNDDTVLQSEAMIPLGEHGLIVSGSTEPRAFSETDVSLLEIFSSTVEAALNRSEREQQLRETRARLEQSNEDLEQFAYAASHDLQEPLRTVSSYLMLLERRYREDLDEDAQELIDIAVEGADRMRDMIQALLAYSRVDTRGGSFEPTEMTTVFERVRQNLEVTIDESNATVEFPDDVGTVSGDESQLVQLFQNLVENGLKYNDGDPHVEVSVDRSDDSLEFAVSDDGIGMASTQLDDIFEVFQRLHTREEFDGTGIGLSICKKIADRHGGDIRVDSEPGSGSTFYVTLDALEDVDE